MIKSVGNRAAILFILVGGIGAGTLAYYVKSTPRAAHVPQEIRVVEEPKDSTPAPRPTPQPEETKEPPKASVADTVRLPVFGDEISDMELAKQTTPVPDGQDARTFIATRIAEAAHIDGARVLGIDVRDHVAFVNYNDAVEKGMGSMEEGAFLRALQIGFGQFTDIDKVAIESEGKPLESGHVDLSDPLPVVRPGQKEPAEEPKSVEP